MRDTYRPRRLLVVLAALLLPAATCGVAPALQELVGRVNLLESRAERLERFAANAQLPSVLVDEHNIVVGTVLEYNDMFLYASINETTSPYALSDGRALATIQVPLAGRAPLVLEANREALLAPTRAWKELFYFETPDCTGAPSTLEWPAEWGWPGPETTAFTRVYIGPPGRTLYALAPDEPTQHVSLQSRLRQRGIEGQTQSECIRQNAVTGLRHRFERVADLDIYTPPFRIVDQRELWGF